MDAVTLALAKAETAKLENTLLEDQEVTIAWDGDPTGKEMAWGNTEQTYGYCWVSALTPDRNDLEKSTIVALNLENGEETQGVLGTDGFNIGDGCIVVGGFIALVVAVAYKDNVTWNKWCFPKAGLYFGYNLGITVKRMTFNTKLIKKELIPDNLPTVFDLDAMGIDVQSLVLSGGGDVSIDASAIFNNIVRGGSYIFRGSFAGYSMDILPSFYQWNTDGSLECIGFAIAGNVSGFVQVHYLIGRDYLTAVITPLGA